MKLKILFAALAASCAAFLSAAESAPAAVAGKSEAEIRQIKADLHRAATGEELVFLPDGATARIAPLGAGTVTVSNVRAAQREGTKLVDVYYDLASTSGYKCKVQFAVTRGGTAVTVADSNRSGDIGDWVSAGSNRHIVWNAGADCPNTRSFDYKVSVTATENTEQVDGEWATITIAWSAYGGRDLDICGYWVNYSSQQYGWSHGSGSTTDANRSLWRGDNRYSGPEYLLAGVDATRRVYRVHFNYFGSSGSPARADVSVTGNGVTKSITSKTGTHSGGAAYTSDPYVTIYFDESGTPTNITRSAEL